MAAPATTGQLRTKVSDMQIGDYIISTYVGNTVKTPAGHFGGIGYNSLSDTGFSEIATTGIAGMSAGGMGDFYFIKVAKGLLVSDRVVMNTIAWDTLNTAKYIQGSPFDNGNIIPTMTSNTAPSGVASASSYPSNGSGDPWHAFDHSTSSSNWIANSGQTIGWLSYDFQSSKNIKAYALSCFSTTGYENSMPKNWTFEGSNDGTTWTILDSQFNQTGWTAGKRKLYLLPKSATYSKYRINISANNGDTGLALAELEMMDTAGIIRSLTGGVAYADANGNSATTDAGKGGWPTNNEWDKFIVNFPSNLIQSGKALDDVFHWGGTSSTALSTWCQETPTLALSANTNRVFRGSMTNSDHEKYFGYNAPSSQADVYRGFRPVFEYKE